MSLTDFGAHLDAQTVHLIYHGGCPDGCLAALIMRQAIAERFKPLSLELIPAAHAGRNADKVTEGSTAIFVDVSPTVEDEQQLQKCRCVLLLDHHPSAAIAQKHLQATLPQLANFSDISGPECGATLAIRFCASSVVPPWLVHLFHKLDVFDHQLPDDLAKHLDAFKGFITQRGFGKCTVELVEELLADTDAALERGRQLYASVAEHTEKVFARRILQIDIAKVSVWAAEFSGEDDKAATRGIDFELYQSLIDKIDSTKPVVFATLNRTPMSSGLWTVGLRRVGDALDVGAIAKKLGECSELAFKTGGGHAYAAGAQCNDFDLSAERICKQIADICTDMLIEDEETPAGLVPQR